MSEQEKYFDFDSDISKEYEKGIRITNPTYDQLFTMSHAFLRSALGEKANLLIVGAGGGMELVTFGMPNPQWSMTGIDPSEQMLEYARRKLEQNDLTERVKLVRGVVDDLPSDLHYDGATCILVLHFLPDDGSKLKLLESIADRLSSKAPLILASLVGEVNSPQFEQYFHAWETYLLSLHHPKTEQIIHNLKQLRTATHFVPEERIVELLDQAGFENISRFYTTWLFGGWVAVRKDC